jgi:hypothetical protein
MRTAQDGAICDTGMSARRGRRWVLAAAFCGTREVWAQASVKVSRAEVRYQDTPRGGLSCVGCTFFRRPRSCQVVEGDISPNGWCRLFDLPD